MVCHLLHGHECYVEGYLISPFPTQSNGSFLGCFHRDNEDSAPRVFYCMSLKVRMQVETQGKHH